MRHDTRGLLPKACIWSAVVVLTALFLTAPALAESRTCATTTLDEPFVLPGGFEHAPGKLTLCRAAVHTPSKAMYVSYVDRAPVRMLFSRRGLSEGPAENEPYMMFARDRAGRLHLYGLAIPCRDGMETFEFEDFPSDQARVSTQALLRG